MIGDGLGVRDDGALAEDYPLGVIGAIARRPRIPAPCERGVFIERAIGEVSDVIEVERSLRRHALCVAVLVLHHAQHRRIVEVERLRNAAALVAEHEPLGRCRRFDKICRVAEERLDEIALGEEQRLDDVTGEEPVLRDDARVERELCDAVRDEIEIGALLHVLGEQLEEPGVVHRVIVVVAGVHVERVLGHRPRGDVEHVGESLADGGVERLVHVGDPLSAREIGGAEPGHRHAGSHGGGGVFTLGLEEEQAPAVHVALSLGHRDRPTFAHLRRRRDGIGTGRFAPRRFHCDHGAAAVERLQYTRIRGGGRSGLFRLRGCP